MNVTFKLMEDKVSSLLEPKIHRIYNSTLEFTSTLSIPS